MTHEQTDDGAAGRPSGEVYDWYQRGLRLLDSGDAAAAAQILGHAVHAEPRSRSLREALARAHFDAGQFVAARDGFRHLMESRPDDHYAHFGYGLSSWRLGDLETARQHLAAATAMRPSTRHYATALGQVTATLRARAAAAGGSSTEDDDGPGAEPAGEDHRTARESGDSPGTPSGGAE